MAGDANSTALPVCGKCEAPIQESDTATTCVGCKAPFHLACTGQAKVSARFGCEFCYSRPGNAPQGRLSEETPGPSRAPPPGRSDEDIKALILSTMASFFDDKGSDKTVRRGDAAGATARPPTSHSRPAPQSFYDCEGPLNVTQARNTAEFLHCLGQAPADSGPPVYGRSLPPLPKFDGAPKDWPMFISSFHESTQRHNISNVDNMARLREALHGTAARVVEGSMLHASSLFHVLDTLRESFGDPSKVLQHLEQELTGAPRVDINGKGLQLLSVKTTSLVNILEACGMEDQLRNQSLVNTLQEKLPLWMALRWADFGDGQNSGVGGFAAFLKREVSRALRVGQNQVRLADDNSRRTVLAISQVPAETDDRPQVDASPPSATVPDRCLCCERDHSLDKCPTFLAMDDVGRRTVVDTHRLCLRCLRRSAWPHRCSARGRCLAEGCEFRHHPLVHGVCRLKFGGASHTSGTTATTVTEASHLFKVVPVVITHGTTSVSVYALIDEASSLTLMDNSLADELGLQGVPEPLTMKWTDQHTSTDVSSRRVSCRIHGADGTHVLDNVSTWDLDLPMQTLSSETISALQVPVGTLSPYRDARPRILIGLPHARLSMSLESHECPHTGLISARTRLGWTLYAGGASGAHVVGLHYRIGGRPNDSDLATRMDEFFATESFGVRAAPHVLGAEDARALSILQTTVRKVGDRYETGLLWRDDQPRLPDTLWSCDLRARQLRRKMDADPELDRRLSVLVASYLEKEYITDVTNVPPVGPAMYLPVFPAYNKNKPEKTRLVWDAAAATRGRSLNSFLLAGPDYLVPLCNALIRYRERLVAFTADVPEMFHQVLVRAPDRDAQRFLWYSSGADRPTIFRMNVMTFGASCSPTTAQYVKNTHAEGFRREFPRAVDAIQRNFYVDDWLQSCDSVEEASSLMREVVAILGSGGFQLAKWRSSHPEVLAGVAAAPKSKALAPSEEKVLGLVWDSSRDTLRVSLTNVVAMRDARPLTKRKLLQGMMSLFDPLGLCAAVVMKAKILVRDVWRLGAGWDEEVPAGIRIRWESWCDGLAGLARLEIPRCYGLSTQAPWELHTFVDASDQGFAAAAYLRGPNAHGELTSRLVAAKTRVAPLRSLTMPRMELQAAVMGVRLAATVEAALTHQITARTFWSDSQDVLHWIRSRHRRYHAFVAARINEILDSSREEEWRWVPTQLNVADEATRFSGELVSERWLDGPSFLRTRADTWPEDLRGPHCDNTGEEIHHVLKTKVVSSLGLVPALTRISSWDKLLRVTAYALRFFYRRRRPSLMVNFEELARAEMEVVRAAQREAFSDVVLPTGVAQVEKSHPLYRICPILDQDGILRVDGRLPPSFPLSVRQPAILPRDHPFTALLVQREHERFLHQHGSTVVNALRQRFYIPGLRRLLRSVASRCAKCRVQKARPQVPRMGPLPEARAAVGWKPFSFCGLDYFGPLEVINARRREKRWVALFTCMTTRAVHVEVAHSLDAHSCLMCIRDMIARRDVQPLEIWSDNGTNFVAASKELHKLSERFPAIKWRFNPPAAPHMGGCWERMVRSIKTCLAAVVGAQCLTDESLRSALLECEWVVNTHPLTEVSLHHEDEEALTPHHFLNGGSRGQIFQGIGVEPETRGQFLRRAWRASQQVADHFWRRFSLEIVPELNMRTRWYAAGEPLAVDDQVVFPDSSRRGWWRRGRVIETIVGPRSDQVRQVRIRTTAGELVRPAVQVAKLDVGEAVAPRVGGCCESS